MELQWLHQQRRNAICARSQFHIFVCTKKNPFKAVICLCLDCAHFICIFTLDFRYNVYSSSLHLMFRLSNTHIVHFTINIYTLAIRLRNPHNQVNTHWYRNSLNYNLIYISIKHTVKMLCQVRKINQIGCYC